MYLSGQPKGEARDESQFGLPEQRFGVSFKRRGEERLDICINSNSGGLID